MAHHATPKAPTTRRRTPRAAPRHAEHEPPRLSVSLTWSDRRSVVLLAGDLVACTTVALDPANDQLIGSGFDEVVLDVSGLRHLDASGALALAELWTELRDDGVICRVRGLPQRFSDSPFDLLDHVRGLDPSGYTLESKSTILSD